MQPIAPTLIKLTPMTREMYHRYAREYENDPDLYREGQPYERYCYSEERADRYLARQAEKQRILLAILCGDEIAGEVVIKNIEAKQSAAMGITLKNAGYKDRGIGTQAEKLAAGYVFGELDIPVLFADTLKTNARSRHVLEKLGFVFIREDEDFRYYRLDRERFCPGADTEDERC